MWFNVQDLFFYTRNFIYILRSKVSIFVIYNYLWLKCYLLWKVISFTPSKTRWVIKFFISNKYSKRRSEMEVVIEWNGKVSINRGGSEREHWRWAEKQFPGRANLTFYGLPEYSILISNTFKSQTFILDIYFLFTTTRINKEMWNK